MAWFWPFALLCSALAQAASAQDTCLSVEESPYVWFGTKTAYPFVSNMNGVPTSRIHDVPGCRAVAFWLLARHGSHLPEVTEVRELQALEDLKRNIDDNYRRGNFRDTNARMCATDLQLLQRWTWARQHDGANAGTLSNEGYMDAQRLAQAWRRRYPDLLTNNRHDYLFKFASDKRSSTSLRAFTEGLFGQQAENIDILRENDEKLLRPYKYCPAWTKDVQDNNDTLSQVRIFESKAEYREMISNISRRLGFNYELDVSMVKRMYQMCRYNKAWDVTQLSSWCAVFSKEDLKRLEYAEDLETYHKYGYGSPLNAKLGCGMVKDLMGFFKNQVEHDGTPQQPRSKIHLSDAESVLLTATALDVFRDFTPLTGDNYHGPRAQGRRWRSSYLAPYGANLAAVLYRCNDNNVNGKYQVMLLWNEQPLQLEPCRVGLCEWGALWQRYGALVDTCDMTFCNGAAATAVYRQAVLASLVAAVAVAASLLPRI